ncbi:MAG: class III signal peptide-containing protein [Methanobacteriota archaeon]|nr:MAG: class III signal peptide-containing protein [Euryarchaeota archaeon]
MEFICDEGGQGAIEYILLAGSIIVAAVMIFSMYSKMNLAARNRVEVTTSAASSTMSSKISAEVTQMA